MDSLPSSEQDALKDRLEVSSPVALLESGLNCIRQGHYSEGIAFFALARERLSPNLMHLISVLDTCIQDYVGYLQVQQAFQQASERFVQAHAKQQTHAASLEKLLSELVRDTDSNHSATDKKGPENQYLSQSESNHSKSDQVVPTIMGSIRKS